MEQSHAPDPSSSEATEINGFPLVDDKGTVVTRDRRKTERRHWQGKPSFPLVDSDGDVVTHNRRRVVERRLGRAGDDASTGDAPERGQVLVVRFDGGVWELGLDSKALMLGRSDECQVRIANRFVSRDHARIEVADDGFLLIDSSSNGTFVRFDQGGVEEVFHGSLHLEASGLMRLGRPVEDGADDLIRFRLRV